MKKLLMILPFLMVLFFSGCASTTQGSVVKADRKQLLLGVSEKTMNQAALQAYNQTLTQAYNKNTLNVDKGQTIRVRKISNALINHVDIFRPDAKKWDWEVNVIKDKTVNAWCMPGGKIAVYTGIIDSLKLSDGELAAILGHEIAHALREHSRERASSDMLLGAGLTIISAVTGLGDLGNTALNLAAQYTIAMPFSRSHESEADIIGLELMARAGYNPNSAVNVWRKMNQLDENSIPEILSTHPSHDTRIKDLEEMIPKVMPLYENSKKMD